MFSLSDMPEVVMGKILEDLDYQAIFQLRKVCHNLRNFIDDVKPEFSITKMFVHLNTNSVKIGLQDSKTGIPIHIEYENQGDQCLITSGWSGILKRQTIQNSNYMEFFCGDFQLLLSHLKTTLLESVEFVALEVPELLQEVLQSKKLPLKSQIFVVKTSNQHEVMKLLPYLNADCLDKIVISSSYSGAKREVWNIDKIVETEQWKKAKVLDMTLIFSRNSITECSHFWRAHFFLETVSTEDLIQMKEALLKPRTLKHILVGYYNDNVVMEHLQKVFGRPYFQNEERDFDRGQWFWKIPDFDKILHLRLDTCKSLIFNHVDSIPDGAV